MCCRRNEVKKPNRGRRCMSCTLCTSYGFGGCGRDDEGAVMNNDAQQQRLALARRLRAHGVPLEITDDDHRSRHFPPPGLFIRQIMASATQLDLYEVGYSVCLRIINTLPSAFWIYGFHLQLPWKDDKLWLLSDPAEYEPPQARYKFLTTNVPSFPRHEVLNHLRPYQLSRGHPLEGTLLWSGEVPIPETYVKGNAIEAFVVILDQYRRGYLEPLSLQVSRRKSRVRALREWSRRDITGMGAIAAASLGQVFERQSSCEKKGELSKTSTDANAVIAPLRSGLAPTE